MLHLLLLYLVTAGVFLILDAIMLSTIMKPLFETHVGDLMADQLRLGPAALFYLVYVAGVLWFVSLPALRADAPALLTGMFPDMIQAGTLAPLTDPGTAEARRDLLFEERAKWLFMTGRRLADLRRLVTQYGLTEDEAYPSGLYFKPGEGDYGDDGVFDVDVEEANNPLYSVGSCDPTNISLGG